MTDGRVMLYVGGPLDGRKEPGRLTSGTPWPYVSCAKPAGHDWQHYTHVGDGTYQHEGRCVDIDHNGPGPGDYRCCCGRDDCSANGSWP